MPIKLSLELVGPIEEGDHVILSGAAMLLFALANNAMTEGEDTSEDEGAGEEPAPFPSPCNKPEDGTDRVCVGPVGHRGRHLYRGVSASPVMN